MAIYRLSIKLCREAITKKIDYIQREGRYSRGEKSEELRETWSSNLPSWAKNDHDFWSAIEDFEKPGQVQARGIELALPIELSNTEQRKLVKQFCSENLANHACSIAIHDSLSGNNPHVHIYFCERKIDKSKKEPDRKHYCKQRTGYSKDRAITGSGRKKWLKNLRKSWENELNNALAKNGYEERVSCESLKVQGIERIPQIHVGYKDYALKRRTGESGTRMKKNEEINRTNSRILELIKEQTQLEAEKQQLEQELDKIEAQIMEDNREKKVENQYQKIINDMMERQRREAEEKERQEQEERQRREAEEKQRQEQEERQRREAEEKERREQEERQRREAEEKERQEQEERQRREAEEKERQEQEERQRREAEEKQRREQEERQRREAEEKQRREQEERQRREAEEKERQEQEEQKQSLPRKQILRITRGIKRRGAPAAIILTFVDGSSKLYTSKNLNSVIDEHGEDLKEYYKRHPQVTADKQITKESLAREKAHELNKSLGKKR